MSYNYSIPTYQPSMIIYSPFMTENRISVLLPMFYQAISRGKRIVVITKPLEERPKSELEKYKKCEKGLRDIGVSILHKKGMHEKIILVDDRIIWTGSLNALSYTGNTVEVMERRIDNSPDKSLINSYIKILDIKYLTEALENDYETKCPICHSEMIIAESDDGGIYWKCVNGDYKRNKDQSFPVDGVLLCAKCNSPFKFAMTNKPRWVCTADSKHYQFLRKNDLKLPKMAALVSKADQKRIQDYFEELENKNALPSVNTYGGENKLKSHGDSALISSYNQEAKKQALQKASGKENRQKVKENCTESVQVQKKPLGRPILKLDDEGIVISEYESLAAAIADTGINSKSIRDAANGVQKHAGGFCWKYKDSQYV